MEPAITVNFKLSIVSNRHFYGHEMFCTGRAYVCVKGIINIEICVTEDPLSHIESLLEEGFPEDVVLEILEAAYSANCSDYLKNKKRRAKPSNVCFEELGVEAIL